MNRCILSTAVPTRTVLLFGLFFAGTANTVGATNYYVSPTGNDSNTGTSVNAPFLSPQRCADVAVAGDTCYFRGGIFHSASTILAITTSGTTGNPITFKKYGSETPVFSVATHMVNIYGVHLRDSSWIVIDGLKVVGGDYGIVLADGSSHSQILSNDVSGGYRGGIHVGTGCGHNLIQGNRVSDNNQINWPRGEAYSNGGAWGSAISIGTGSDYNLLQGNYVYWNHGEGVVFEGASQNIAHRNVIADNWSANIRIAGGNNVVDANLVYQSEAAKAWRVTLGNNLSNAEGIAISEASSGVTLSDLQVANNIVVNALTCIHARAEPPANAVGGWRLTNNTCVSNDSGIKLLSGGVGISRMVVQNNIVIRGSIDDNPTVQVVPAATASSFRNNIYTGTAANTFYWADQTPRSFTNWVVASGEARSSSTDPLLVDATAIPARLWDDPGGLGPGSPTTALSIREFSPTASSPAIDAGVDYVGSHTQGYYGLHRDVGALEYCDSGDTGTNDATSPPPVCASNFLPLEPAK